MAPISIIRNTNVIQADIYQYNGSRKTVLVTTKRSGIVFTTSKQDHKRLLDVYENIAQREAEQITYAFTKSIDSMNDQVMVSKSILRQLLGGGKNSKLQIKDD